MSDFLEFCECAKIYDCNTVYYSYKLLPNIGISHMIFVAGGFASFSFNCTHSVILRLPLKFQKYLSLCT